MKVQVRVETRAEAIKVVSRLIREGYADVTFSMDQSCFLVSAQ